MASRPGREGRCRTGSTAPAGAPRACDMEGQLCAHQWADTRPWGAQAGPGRALQRFTGLSGGPRKFQAPQPRASGTGEPPGLPPWSARVRPEQCGVRSTQALPRPGPGPASAHWPHCHPEHIEGGRTMGVSERCRNIGSSCQEGRALRNQPRVQCFMFQKQTMRLGEKRGQACSEGVAKPGLRAP